MLRVVAAALDQAGLAVVGAGSLQGSASPLLIVILLTRPTAPVIGGLLDIATLVLHHRITLQYFHLVLDELVLDAGSLVLR